MAAMSDQQVYFSETRKIDRFDMITVKTDASLTDGAAPKISGPKSTFTAAAAYVIRI
jgi:hypothetical protein